MTPYDLSTENGVFYQHYQQYNMQKVKKKLINNQHIILIHNFMV